MADQVELPQSLADLGQLVSNSSWTRGGTSNTGIFLFFLRRFLRFFFAGAGGSGGGE